MAMNSEDNRNKNDESTIDNYSTRLVELYDEKSTNFWRTLWIVITLSAFFFFIILLPFVMLQDQNYETDLQLNQTIKDIPNTNISIITYSKVEKIIEHLGNRTSNGADELKSYIEIISKEYDDTNIFQNETSIADVQQDDTSQQVGFPPSGFPSCNSEQLKDSWMNCNVTEYLHAQFDNFTTVLNHDVPMKLKGINDSSILPQITMMSSDIQLLSEQFVRNLVLQERNDPQFWRQYSGKSEFYGELYIKLNQFWDKYRFNISTSLTTKLNNLIEKKSGLEDQKNVTESNKAELGNRLARMESPVGTIPIGVNESVAVFPIAMAAGFAIYCYFLGSGMKLRKALYQWHKKDTPHDNKDLKNKISLIAPLWIDPTHSMLNKISRLAILMVPPALFIISWILISDSWTKILDDDMRTTFPYNRDLYKQFYQGLYIFSLLFFLYGISTVLYQWYHYDDKNQYTKTASG